MRYAANGIETRLSFLWLEQLLERRVTSELLEIDPLMQLPRVDCAVPKRVALVERLPEQLHRCISVSENRGDTRPPVGGEPGTGIVSRVHLCEPRCHAFG